jgi:mortality factor 4-like protein 1
LPTVIQGLQIYFDKALGCNLLYRLERQQYSDIRKKYVTGGHVQLEETKAMSEVYGAEHLARMLGSLITHISQTRFETEP